MNAIYRSRTNLPRSVAFNLPLNTTAGFQNRHRYHSGSNTLRCFHKIKSVVHRHGKTHYAYKNPSHNEIYVGNQSSIKDISCSGLPIIRPLRLSKFLKKLEPTKGDNSIKELPGQESKTETILNLKPSWLALIVFPCLTPTTNRPPFAPPALLDSISPRPDPFSICLDGIHPNEYRCGPEGYTGLEPARTVPGSPRL